MKLTKSQKEANQKARQAIKKMLKDPTVKVTKNLLHRNEIGSVTIEQGKAYTDSEGNRRGYGLKHIAHKHGKNIKLLKDNIPAVIVRTISRGSISNHPTTEGKRIIQTQPKRKKQGSTVIIETKSKKKLQNTIVTAFRKDEHMAKKKIKRK